MTAGTGGHSTHKSDHVTHERVLLHVYELGTGTRLADAIRGLNAFTKTGLGAGGHWTPCASRDHPPQPVPAPRIAGGVFHGAVEVENMGKGLEWSYGYAAQGSGVFAFRAKEHPNHRYRETVVLGRTTTTREQLLQTLRRMQAEWGGEDYHLVRCNCISFCHALSSQLSVGPIPDWVDRFPRIGAGSLDIAETVSDWAVAAKESLATALPLGTITQLTEVTTTTTTPTSNDVAAAATTTPAGDAAGEIINVCSACVYGMAAYTSMQIGRLSRALSIEADSSRATDTAEDAVPGKGAAPAAAAPAPAAVAT